WSRTEDPRQPGPRRDRPCTLRPPRPGTTSGAGRGSMPPATPQCPSCPRGSRESRSQARSFRASSRRLLLQVARSLVRLRDNRWLLTRGVHLGVYRRRRAAVVLVHVGLRREIRPHEKPPWSLAGSGAGRRFCPLLVSDTGRNRFVGRLVADPPRSWLRQAGDAPTDVDPAGPWSRTGDVSTEPRLDRDNGPPGALAGREWLARSASICSDTGGEGFVGRDLLPPVPVQHEAGPIGGGGGLVVAAEGELGFSQGGGRWAALDEEGGVEAGHQVGGGAVPHVPGADHHAAGSGAKKGLGEPHHALSPHLSAQSRLAGAQDDQVGRQ